MLTESVESGYNISRKVIQTKIKNKIMKIHKRKRLLLGVAIGFAAVPAMMAAININKTLDSMAESGTGVSSLSPGECAFGENSALCNVDGTAVEYDCTYSSGTATCTPKDDSGSSGTSGSLSELSGCTANGDGSYTCGGILIGGNSGDSGSSDDDDDINAVSGTSPTGGHTPTGSGTSGTSDTSDTSDTGGTSDTGTSGTDTSGTSGTDTSGTSGTDTSDTSETSDTNDGSDTSDNTDGTDSGDEEDEVEYTMSAGYQTITGGEDFVITTSGKADKFVALLIDGVEVDEANYTIGSDSDGNMTLTIKNAFAKTLGIGEHSIVIVWDDGEATGTLLADGSGLAIEDDEDESEDSGLVVPNTGAVTDEDGGINGAGITLIGAAVCMVMTVAVGYLCREGRKVQFEKK